MNGQHRGDGHPYGGDEPTPSDSGQESFRPRHGSPWPDEERPEAERPYGAPYEGTGRPPGYPEGDPYRGDPYGGPRGPEAQAPYAPGDYGRPEPDTAAPTSAFQAFMAGEDRAPRDPGYRPEPPEPGFRGGPPEPGYRPEPPEPGFRGGPPEPGYRPEPPESGFRGGPPEPGYRPEPPESGYRSGPAGPGPDPRNAGPYAPGDPYAPGPPPGPPPGPSSAAPYGDAPRGGDVPPDFARGEPRNAPPSPDEGRFSAGALGGGRFSADALSGGPRPDAPRPDVPGDVRDPGPQDGPPRYPSEEPTVRHQRRPEWESKPYAPPNAATEALPSVDSRDRRVASGNSRPRTEPPPEQGPDAAAPTSAFQAFMAGQDQAAGNRGFREQDRGRDMDERGRRDVERDRDVDDRGRRDFDRGREFDRGRADEPAGYRAYGRGRDDAYDEHSSAPTWSLVLSIVGIIAMPFLGLGVIASVAALILARNAERSGHGSGKAGAGKFLGWIGVGFFVVGVLGLLVYAVV